MRMSTYAFYFMSWVMRMSTCAFYFMSWVMRMSTYAFYFMSCLEFKIYIYMEFKI